ncbi:MAG: DUF4258 domain-containing protein [Nitrospirae bacterium]|nr:DUF4258 domain-containing protein [Nitrospirota bacterium]
MNLIDQIKQAAVRKIIYTSHAVDEMNAEDKLITVAEVRQVVLNGEIIEDYPKDKRGHSCLMLGIPETQRPIHVVCAPKEEYLAIITAYIPSLEKWQEDFKTRRKK